MPLALAYMIVRFVLALVAVLVRGDVSKEAELLVLRHENAVLRRQVSRRRYGPVDRIWFVALSRLVPRRLWPMVFPVTAATILRWHRRRVARKWTGAPSQRAMVVLPLPTQPMIAILLTFPTRYRRSRLISAPWPLASAWA